MYKPARVRFKQKFHRENQRIGHADSSRSAQIGLKLHHEMGGSRCFEVIATFGFIIQRADQIIFFNRESRGFNDIKVTRKSIKRRKSSRS